jgi:CHAD domain-containing protein
VKARKVKGLDCEASLAHNAQRILAVRLEELLGFMPAALDPDEVDALHDMRIAAKRVRYVLEVTEECFGPFGPDVRKKAKELQDILGEIHDCDVLLPQVGGALADRLRARRQEQFDRFRTFWGTTVPTTA